MSRFKENTILAMIAILVVSSVFSLWVVTRVSVPEDVVAKLDPELISRIQFGQWNTKYDCIVACTSSEDMQSVLNSLPSESIEGVWDSFNIFHSTLTPDQIFSIARMSEVTRIDFNSVWIVIC